MPEPFIQINSLTKTYETQAGYLNVLRGIDLTIDRGDFISLIGPSGGGKTTFLNMITAIDTPTSGKVTVDGIDVVNAPKRELVKWRGRNIGIIFQFFQLLPTLTVVQNVIAPMDFCNVHKPSERKDKAMALLERFGIADQANKTPDMLSGGQQQRVAIARALANDPALIIGDEPTGNLDRMSAGIVFDTFNELSEQGSTVLVVTHDRELGKNVRKVMTLSDGLIEGSSVEAAGRRRTQELEALRTHELRAVKKGQ